MILLLPLLYHPRQTELYRRQTRLPHYNMTPLLLIIWTTALALLLSLTLVFTSVRSKRKSEQANTKTLPANLTYRISNIPRHLTKAQFHDILLDLPGDITSKNTADQANVLGWSFAPTAAFALSERFWVATVTFRVPPPLHELETSLRRNIGFEAARLKLDLDFSGLTPLFDPEQGVAVE